MYTFIKEPVCDTDDIRQPTTDSGIFRLRTVHARSRSNKSHGHDEIHPKVIKELRYKISTILCHIFNQSFKTGIIPNELKISLITPIFKN
jgi:hypothetical protein